MSLVSLLAVGHTRPRMPLNEYACDACAHQFEELVFGSRTVSCPRCGTANVKRLMSTIAIGRGTERAPGGSPAPCGTCGDPRGPGACSMS